MESQNHIAATPGPARVSPAPVSTAARVSFTTNRFPAWMNRHPTWIASVVAVITLVMLLGMGWAARTVQERLVQSAGHSLVQAATDAASKLDMMILERYRDIQLLSTAPITQGQNPEALTKYLRELVHAHPAYRWIGVTDSHGKIIATTDTSTTSLDRSQSHWFQLARTITNARILDVQVSDESGGTSAITVIAPLRSPDGRFLGAIAAVVGVSSLMHILDDTMQVLKNIEWTEESHIEYQLLNEKGDLIADSTLRQEGNLNMKQLGIHSAPLVGMNARGFVEETHLRRGASVITAYAQVTIAHADPTLRWNILIRVDRDSILAPIRSFLLKLSFLAILILLPLLGLVVGMIKALHGEWGTAKREFERATDAETTLTKRTEALHTLVVAAQTLSAQQDLDGLLHQLFLLAKENTGACYAALEVYHDTSRDGTQFLAAGIDDAAAHAIRTLPPTGRVGISWARGRRPPSGSSHGTLGRPRTSRRLCPHDIVPRRVDTMPWPILWPAFSRQQTDAERPRGRFQRTGRTGCADPCLSGWYGDSESATPPRFQGTGQARFVDGVAESFDDAHCIDTGTIAG